MWRLGPASRGPETLSLTGSMGSMLTWLDEYERRARAIPGLLVLLPLIVLALAIGIRSWPVAVSIGASFVAVGMPVVIAEAVRQEGQRLQTRLWSNWGGPPTDVLLHVGGGDNDAVRDRRRLDVEKATQLSLPTADEEQQDIQAAARRYRAAVTRLTSNMNSDRTKFRLVFEENKNYGFARNLLAVRRFGIGSGVASLIGCGAAIATALTVRSSLHVPDLILGVLASNLVLVFWVFGPSEGRVRQSAFTYAERVLDSASLVVPGS